MQWCLAHECTGADNLIFFINMGLIHMLADVLATKLTNRFCGVWNIRISEKGICLSTIILYKQEHYGEQYANCNNIIKIIIIK